MISDRCFSAEILKEFLSENDTAFTHPLSEVLKKRGISFDEYAEKLAKLGTVAYEKDEETGKIKGVVIGYAHNLPEDGGSYITQAVTGIEFRRQGVCRKLLKEYFDYCQSIGITYVWLTTGENNTSARITYERAGFELKPYNQPNTVKYVKKLSEKGGNGD